MAARGHRWPCKLNSIVFIRDRNGEDADGCARNLLPNLAATVSIASDNKGPMIRISKSADTGILREAYKPEYTAKNTTMIWRKLSLRFVPAKATNVSITNPAKHFCAT